jgi:tetratricopeptide (TPR) repeat protein
LKATDKAIKAVLQITDQNIELIKLLYEYRQMPGDSRGKSGGNDLEIAAKIWEGFNRNDQSVQCYLKAIKEEDGNKYPQYLKAAKSFRNLEKFREAKELLDEASRHGFVNQNDIESELGEMEGLRKEWLGKAKGYEEKKDWINTLLYARKIEANYGRIEEIQGLMNWALECRKERIQQAETEGKAKEEVEKIRDRYNRLLAEAQKKFNEKDYAGALPLLENAVAFQGIDNSEAESLLGCCHSEQGKIEEAIRIFQKLIEKNPDLLFIYKNMGRAYLRNGLFYEGIHTLEMLAERDPGYADLYYEVGNIYFQLGDYEKAAASFEKYLQGYPESYEGHTRKGNCYMAKGWLSVAENCYRRALSIKPEYDPARLAIQKVREFKGKMDRRRANSLT